VAPRALQPNGNVNERERGGRDAGNAAGLADGDRADAFEYFAHLAREAADGAVLDPSGDGDGLGGFELCDGLPLLLEVAGEFDFCFDGAGFVAEALRAIEESLTAPTPSWFPTLGPDFPSESKSKDGKPST